MDLELTDEQQWLSEAVETLLGRVWPALERRTRRGATRRRSGRRSSRSAPSAWIATRGSALSSCAWCRGRWAPRLACAPYRRQRRPALRRRAAGRSAARGIRELVAGDDSVSVALLEPGRGWSVTGTETTLGPGGLRGHKVAVEHAEAVDRLAVVATLGGTPGLVLLRPARPASPSPRSRPSTRGADERGRPRRRRRARGGVAEGPVAAELLRRLTLTGGLLAAAEAVGAAGRLLEDARTYAGERRQFGRTIGSYQALRHILADMYVRQASMWSTVLYAAAALDDDLDEARRAAAVAKAYVSRSAREVAHGALQVFGGIAFTAGAPRAPVPAPHRRARAAVRRRRPSRARARAGARRGRGRPATAHDRQLGRAGFGPLTGDDSGWIRRTASTTRPPSAWSA